jgi:CRP/FNR family cyclic AMP-dependent transcriptional regulator
MSEAVVTPTEEVAKAEKTVPKDAQLLASVPLFQDLAEDDRLALALEMEEVCFEKGRALCTFGDPGDSMYIVREGEVEIYIRNDTGEKVTLETCGCGGFFGEISLLDSGPRTATIEALTDVEALKLDRKHLEHFLQEHPSAVLGMLGIMSKRLRNVDDKLRHTATRNVNDEVEDKRTPIVKVADAVAEFAGSISFVLLHAAVFAVWIIWNKINGLPHFDNDQYGLLTMIVSLEAIFLSTFVLLAANRQAEKDRVHADIEYDVNLKAELEVAHLHVKMDELRTDLLRHMHRLERSMGGGEADERLDARERA